MDTTQKLSLLRTLMQQHQLDAWLIPTADPHLSEYLPEHWQARAWFSGFTGSAGLVVVTQSEACLWTDSRYWEQAEQQLAGSEIVLEKLGLGRNYIDWLITRLPEKAKVGVAADMFSLADKRAFMQQTAKQQFELILDWDLIAQIWTQRPALPKQAIRIHGVEWSGESVSSKLARVRQAMQAMGAKTHLVSALDDIAWLTNLRGADIAFNPVFLSHLLIELNHATLFVDPEQVNGDIEQILAQAGITLAPYEQASQVLATLSGSLLIEPAKTAMSILARLPEKSLLIEQTLPSSLFKAQKNAQEMAHIRQAMQQDGAALCGFFAEFEHKMQAGEKITEYDIHTMLWQHRSQQPHFIGCSFETIAGFNANAAMPHYCATATQHSLITGNGVLLIDSGAQYLNGTTDITRVIPIGTPSQAQKQDFTHVLKAHIALAQLVFPEGILSPMLDAVCRQALWQVHCDFGHGTGHGVGYFLNVHEGPQRIAYQATPQKTQAMQVGMLTSNEPGLYRSQRWGIRIENLMLNQRVESPKETEFGQYLYFETVTLCPIDTRLIIKELLTQSERDWLNHYHQKVYTELSNRVSGSAHNWLEKRTQAI